jgi:outer membrane protein OmpU
MKSILLTSTALVAFAGAAAAEGHTSIGFSGDVELGYNDNVIGDNDGMYWTGTLGVNMAAEMDNGVTAGASIEIDIVDSEDGAGVGGETTEALVAGDFVLSLTAENAGLFFGDTGFAAFSKWKSAGDMEADGFSEADGETALRGDFTVAGVEASVSYVVGNSNGDTNLVEDLNQLSLGASGSFGNFGVSAAYQAESDEAAGFYSASNGDFTESEMFGVSVNTTFSGATFTLGYAQRTGAGTAADTSSTGVQVAYPFGPVTATAYYVMEDYAGDEDNYGVRVAYAEGPIKVALDYDYDQGTNKLGLDGSYDMGNGLTLLAGVFDQSDSQNTVSGLAIPASDGQDFYVAGTYDLGGGAGLLMSYAEAETGSAIADDEVGGPDYQIGTTVAVTFTF